LLSRKARALKEEGVRGMKAAESQRRTRPPGPMQENRGEAKGRGGKGRLSGKKRDLLENRNKTLLTQSKTFGCLTKRCHLVPKWEQRTREWVESGREGKDLIHVLIPTSQRKCDTRNTKRKKRGGQAAKNTQAANKVKGENARRRPRQQKETLKQENKTRSRRRKGKEKRRLWRNIWRKTIQRKKEGLC